MEHLGRLAKVQKGYSRVADTELTAWNGREPGGAAEHGGEAPTSTATVRARRACCLRHRPLPPRPEEHCLTFYATVQHPHAIGRVQYSLTQLHLSQPVAPSVLSWVGRCGRCSSQAAAKTTAGATLQAALRSHPPSFATPPHPQLSVQGMTCGACTSAVEAALNGLPGVYRAHVALLQQSAEVIMGSQNGHAVPPSVRSPADRAPL